MSWMAGRRPALYVGCRMLGATLGALSNSCSIRPSGELTSDCATPFEASVPVC
jgi:hypothetical protein